MKRNNVSQVEVFDLSGTIPDTVCTKKSLPPFYSGQRVAPPTVRVPEREGILDSAERFMTVDD